MGANFDLLVNCNIFSKKENMSIFRVMNRRKYQNYFHFEICSYFQKSYLTVFICSEVLISKTRKLNTDFEDRYSYQKNNPTL